MIRIVARNHVAATKSNEVGRKLESIRPQLAKAAQDVIDNWQQDEEGYCEVYGGGGPCDDVAQAMWEVVDQAGLVAHEGGHDGDDHAWLIVTDTNNLNPHHLDIPHGLYESGGGYSWTKHDDVQIGPEDVLIHAINWNITFDDDDDY